MGIIGWVGYADLNLADGDQRLILKQGSRLAILQMLDSKYTLEIKTYVFLFQVFVCDAPRDNILRHNTIDLLLSTNTILRAKPTQTFDDPYVLQR